MDNVSFRKVKNLCLAIAVISFWLLIAPVGFDLFYHLYYLNNFELNFLYNNPNYIAGFGLERYFLFPYLVNMLPLPSFWGVLFLTVLAWTVPIYNFFENNKFIVLLAVTISFYFLAFWTPLSISVGCLLSFLLLQNEKKRFAFLFLLPAGIFHPFSIPLVFLVGVYLLFKREVRIQTCCWLLGGVGIALLTAHLAFLSAEEIRIVPSELNVTSHVTFSTADKLFVRPSFEPQGCVELFILIGRKSKEVLIFSLILLLLFFCDTGGLYRMRLKKEVFVFGLLLGMTPFAYKAAINGSILTILLNKETFVLSRYPVDYSIDIGLLASGVERAGSKVMLRDTVSPVFLAFPRWSGASCLDAYSTGFKAELIDPIEVTLEGQAFSEQIGKLKFKGQTDVFNNVRIIKFGDKVFVFNTLAPYIPDYRSAAYSFLIGTDKSF